MDIKAGTGFNIYLYPSLFEKPRIGRHTYFVLVMNFATSLK